LSFFYSPSEDEKKTALVQAPPHHYLHTFLATTANCIFNV